MTKAHEFFARHKAAFPNVLKTQETMDPMIPSRAAAVLPAKLARERQGPVGDFLPPPWPSPCRVAWEPATARLAYFPHRWAQARMSGSPWQSP